MFACNELNLDEIKVYGFDYDYTLACYKQSLNYLLYNLGRQQLVERYKYPADILQLEYTPNWAVRGLHYDIEKGLLLKLDSFLQIQFGTVYRGMTRVPDAEVLRLYRNRIIPLAYVEGSARWSPDAGRAQGKMVQLADLFSVPEMSLLSQVSEWLQASGVDYHPEILFRDIKNSVGASHPIMHRVVSQNVEEYVHRNERLAEYFKVLVGAGKQMFLVTNSPFDFV